MRQILNCNDTETQPVTLKAGQSVAVSVYRVATLAAVITFCVYLPALFNDFVNLDDYVYVVFNQKISSFGMELFRSAFFDFIAELWIPLTWISLAVDHGIWGLNPFGYHLTNAILHACNTFFVSVLAARLVQANAGPGAEDTIGALSHWAVGLIAGLLFGLMPLHVESVAWVTERKDVLNAFFALPGLIMYIRYVQNRGENGGSTILPLTDRRYLSALALFILSLLSKSMTVTFPFVLLLIDWFPLRRFATGKRISPIVLEKIPFFLASLAVGVITVIAQKETIQSFEFASPLTRLLVASKALVFYLQKSVWPSGLMPLYVHPGNSITFFSLEYLLPLLLVFAISGACCWMYLKKRNVILPAVWLFYLVTIFPVLGFSQSGPQAMADRFTYLPSLGPILLAAVCSSRLYGMICCTKLLKIGGIAVGCLIMTGYGIVTVKMIHVWRSTETLWSRVIEITPTQSGRAYFERGQHFVNTGAFEKALPDLSASLQIAQKKQFKNIHKIFALRGDAFLGLGLYQEAVTDYSEAMRFSPEPRYEYYSQRGKALQLAGKYDEASRDLEQAEKYKKRTDH